MKEINMIELFSGTGGFSEGFLQAGYIFKQHYFSEIDKHAIANYKYNYKNAKHIGSVTDVRGNRIEKPDVITFGSPCQDFSLAGNRAGMEGQRSSLILEAIRIVTEYKPSVFIWENVKGAFSSNNGADFWAIITAFANIGGYRLEWQLLNTSWFLPQNRERIYLVGHLTGRSDPGVFPITENNNWINEGTKQTRSIRTLTAGGHSGGLHSSMTLIQSGTWRTHKDGNGFRENKGANCPTLPARSREDGSGQVCIKDKTNIRRLTEIECERLQGFPDNWTKYGTYVDKVGNEVIKEIPKTQRYKMCGNAVTTNVVRIIAEKINITI